MPHCRGVMFSHIESFKDNFCWIKLNLKKENSLNDLASYDLCQAHHHSENTGKYKVGGLYMDIC